MRSLSRTTFSSVGWSHAAVVVLACIILLSASQPVTATPTSYRQQRRASPVSQHSNGPLDRRQVSSQCGANGNSDTICAPKSGDTWQNGTWYQIIWNPSYPSYVSATSLNIYIYLVENYQNKMIKNWTNIDPSLGKLPVLVDDSFYIGLSSSSSQPPNNASAKHEAFVYILGATIDPERELTNRDSSYPQAVTISIAQPPDLPTTTLSAPSSASSSSPEPNSSSSSNGNAHPPQVDNNDNDGSSSSSSSSSNISVSKTVEPWIIGVVAAASVAVVGACIAIVLARRSMRHRQMVFDEKKSHSSSACHYPVNSSIPGTDTQTAPLQDKSTSHISAPQQQQRNNSSGFIAPPTIRTPDSSNCLINSQVESAVSTAAPNASQISARSTSDTPTPPISSTDALMIADTFRQRMRRPEWHGNPFADVDEEEARRCHLSQELMKKELAEEGTLMKKVGKHAHLLNIQSFAEGSVNVHSNEQRQQDA